MAKAKAVTDEMLVAASQVGGWVQARGGGGRRACQQTSVALQVRRQRPCTLFVVFRLQAAADGGSSCGLPQQPTPCPPPAPSLSTSAPVLMRPTRRLWRTR